MLINQPYRTKRSNSIKQGLMTGTVIAMAALFSPCAARDENAGSATVSAVTAAAGPTIGVPHAVAFGRITLQGV